MRSVVSDFGNDENITASVMTLVARLLCVKVIFVDVALVQLIVQATGSTIFNQLARQ